MLGQCSANEATPQAKDFFKRQFFDFLSQIIIQTLILPQFDKNNSDI